MAAVQSISLVGFFRSLEKHAAMRYPYSDVRFTWDEWRRYQNDLALADPVLKSIAAEYGMRLLGSAKYPTRLLKKRRFVKLFLVDLTLDLESARAQQPSYFLTIAYYRISLPLYLKPGGSRTVNKFSSSELQDTAKIKKAIHEAINEMNATYGM